MSRNVETGDLQGTEFALCFVGKNLRKALCSVAAVQHVTEWRILR